MFNVNARVRHSQNSNETVMSYDTYSPFDNSDRSKMTLLLDDQFRSFDYIYYNWAPRNSF